ncbi:MAG TPA: YtxH domain-containing protein [Gemmatimonadales bacterium]|nr:YtxH domain-containing protein [Gemmatimonadales bacterium]
MSTEDRSPGRGGQVGTLFLATVIGVGVGLLAAPGTGSDTRRALRKRLAAAGHDIGEGLEDLEERSRPARRALRARAEQLGRRGRKKYEEALDELEDYEEERDDEESADESGGGFGTVLAVGAGLAAAAYLLTSERAAPARERVREAAATVRDEAEARWDRFQERRGNGHATTESGTRIDPADSAPQAS